MRGTDVVVRSSSRSQGECARVDDSLPQCPKQQQGASHNASVNAPLRGRLLASTFVHGRGLGRERRCSCQMQPLQKMHVSIVGRPQLPVLVGRAAPTSLFHVMLGILLQKGKATCTFLLTLAAAAAAPHRSSIRYMVPKVRTYIPRYQIEFELIKQKDLGEPTMSLIRTSTKHNSTIQQER